MLTQPCCRLAGLGGKVWLAEWNIGATYPSNAMADYCTRDGHVCHEVSDGEDRRARAMLRNAHTRTTSSSSSPPPLLPRRPSSSFRKNSRPDYPPLHGTCSPMPQAQSRGHPFSRLRTSTCLHWEVQAKPLPPSRLRNGQRCADSCGARAWTLTGNCTNHRWEDKKARKTGRANLVDKE